MQFSFKIGNSVPKEHHAFDRKWQHLQLIDIRPNGYYNLCYSSKVFNMIVETPSDFWTARGSTDWKSTKQSVLDFNKYVMAVGSNGKLPWETFYIKDENLVRKRDWYLDWERFVKLASIDKATEELALDPHKYCEMLKYDGDIFQLLKNHYDYPVMSSIQNQPYAAGTYDIGAAGDATDWTDAESKTAATLTGALTWEHLNEDTTFNNTTWEPATATHLFKMTAASGAEHNGAAFGNGARATGGAFQRMKWEEAGAGEMDDIEVSKLAFDTSAGEGLDFYDGGDGGDWTINRLLIKGGAGSTQGIRLYAYSDHVLLTNCIVYGVGEGAGDGGILIDNFSSSPTFRIYNNTCCKNYNNFKQDAGSESGSVTFKNNLAQGDTGGSDYSDDGAGFGTTAKNISEDATSPDAAYRSKDLHTNSVFVNYGADNIKIDKDGDSTNLAIIDDGEDLSGTFTDDINNDATWRSDPYDIGASQREAAVGGNAPTGVFYGPLVGPFGGPI